MRRVFFCFLGLFCSVVQLYAQIEHEGVSYKYSSDYGGLEVIKSLSGHYSGDIVIASEVYYGGRQQPVVSIVPYAFMEDSITSVIIPETVNHIGLMAFWDCDYLLKVYCKREEPVDISYDKIFGSITKKVGTLYVSESAREQYKHATLWGSFSNITGNNNTKPYYTITFSCPEGVALMVNGKVLEIWNEPIDRDFEEGDTVSVQVLTSYKDHHLRYEGVVGDFVVDGEHVESQLEDLTYTFNDIRNNHHVYVSIAFFPFYFSVNQTDQGSFTMKQEEGTDIQIKVEPKDGYEVEQFVITSIGTYRDYTDRPDMWLDSGFNVWFSNTDGDRTLTIRYKRKEAGNE